MQRPLTARRQPTPDSILLAITNRALSAHQAMAFLLVRQHRKGMSTKALSQLLKFPMVKTRRLIRSLQMHRLASFNGSTVKAAKLKPQKWDTAILALDSVIHRLENPSHR